MSGQRFEVVFRGDVEPGRSIIEVKEGLARLFNAEASRIDQMFSGKPVVIKGNLDEEKARHYQSSLKKVGALVEIRAIQSEGAPDRAADDGLVSGDADLVSSDAESGSEEDFDFDFDVAPVGADILPAEHKKDYTPAEVDTSHLTVSDVGADVLDAKDKRVHEDRDVDTSHLSVDALPADDSMRSER